MHQKLNTATEWYTENCRNGLMICGINWGGSESDDAHDISISFFSDGAVNRYPYRNRLVTWFSLFGHPLESVAGKEGAFERSIVQTNWLRSQSTNMRGKSLYHECIRDSKNMVEHLSVLQPRLIILLSVSLLDALNSKEIFPQVNELLGAAQRPCIIKKDVVASGKKLKRFRVGFQEFETASVIALPHPTGSIGISNDYIAAFAPEISKRIDAYKTYRVFNA